MAEEGKFKIEKFNGKNYQHWKMQIVDYLYQKDLYLPLGGLPKKPANMTEDAWEVLDRKALGTIRLCLASTVAFNITEQKTTEDLIKSLDALYEKPSASNKVFLMKRLFNLKMADNGSVAEHLNEYNTNISQLRSVGVTFEDEVRALLILSSLPDSWDSLVMAVSNSISGTNTLKFDDVVGVLISEEMRRKSTGETSSTALTVDTRGRQKERSKNNKNRDRSRRSKSRSKSTAECWNCGKKGHMKKDCWSKKKKEPESDNSKSTSEANVAGEVEQDALILSLDNVSEAWVVDSGASFHATSHRKYFLDYTKGNFGFVYLGDDEACEIVGKGTVSIKLANGNEWVLKDVRHVPSLCKNLISTGQLDDEGCYTAFGKNQWKVSKGSLVVAKGEKVGTLYLCTVNAQPSIYGASTKVDAAVWHHRLGHMSAKGMQILQSKNLLPGLKKVDLEFCEDCVFGKQKRVRFLKLRNEKKSKKLELVHSDVWGPATSTSLGGSLYFVTFIDDPTRKTWVYPMKNKSNVFSIFQRWKALVENEAGTKLKCLRSDNGGEYCSQEFESFCARNGIRRQKTTPRTPQENGVSERMNRTIMERARSMRLHAGLPLTFWAEAVSTAVYLINRSPSTALDGNLPEEAWTGKKVNYSFLKVFGCEAFMHIDKSLRSKLESKSKKCFFIGYGEGDFGYRLWDPKDSKIFRSRDVIFNEDHVFKDYLHEKQTSTAGDEYMELEDNEHSKGGENLQEHQRDEEPQPTIRRTTRVSRPPERFIPSFNHLLVTDSGEPESYHEAMQHSSKKEWEKSMQREMDSLQQNQTWDLVDLPKGKRALQNKWVYRLKEEEGGKRRYKSRLVVKGFAQKQGIDFNEIFSPVVKMNSIRTILSIVAIQDLELEQMDVDTAFLNGDLEEEIYMLQPQGYEVKNKEKMVCRLKKSLYGLKQASRQWYLKFDKFMLDHGFKRCNSDHCVYIKKLGDGKTIILMLYVDDMLIASANMQDIRELKEELSKSFSMKDLGAAKRILGMQISRDRKKKTLTLSQQQYIEKVLERFAMQNAKPVSTPFASHFRLSKDMCPKTQDEIDYMSKVPYASAVGSLMYAMVWTRPDIAHAVGVVSRFMENPGNEHWQAVKWILRYLRGTSTHTLCFGGTNICLQGYADADMAGDKDTRRSTTGYVFTIGGTAVSWASKLQKTVLLSTMEAEYIALTEASKEILWLDRFLEELGHKQDNCVLNSDSQSAIHLAKNAAFHARTKHIEVRYHFIRTLLEEGQLKLAKIHTSKNPADMLTKVVNKEKLSFCSTSIGIQS